jgi:hypothetical protein
MKQVVACRFGVAGRIHLLFILVKTGRLIHMAFTNCIQ